MDFELSLMRTQNLNLLQEEYNYRHTVCKTIPHLKILDDIPTSGEIRPGTASNFENDWSFLQELENDGTIGSLESMEETEQGLLSRITILLYIWVLSFMHIVLQ